MTIFNHSLYDYINAYNNNKHMIDNIIFNNSIEYYGNENTTILGMSVSLFVIGFLISLALWIWGLVLTLKYWQDLPDWAKVLCVIGLLPILPLGPIITIIVAYITKNK